MGTGWRRAFCTTVSSDSGTALVSDKQQQSSSPSPRCSTKQIAGGSAPATPRGHLNPAGESPVLHCRTSTPRAASAKSSSSNPSSPRTPFKLSLFKNSFKFRSSCGICLNSVKTGQGTAIYTAECSHAFHFPCIAAHVRRHGSLVCPVCSAVWKDVPLLAIHKNLHRPENGAGNSTNAVNVEEKEKKVVVLESSPKAIKTKLFESQQQVSNPNTPRKISDSRFYDDDEPLLSPAAGGRFIPIPEADENADEEEDDDVEEFQGFVVNPNPSSVKSDEVPLQGIARESRNVQVKLLPEAAVVSAGRGYETYAVALRVKAPPPLQLNPPHRSPIDLVTVLDLSGSMTGAKLQMLKRAVKLVISSLGAADRLSIVTFSSTPKRLLPLRRMTAHGQRAAARIVDRLVCGQGTSLGDAMRKATKVLEDRRERNPVATIMILSDGHDERVQHTAGHSRFAHIEIPVLAGGFGQIGVYSYEPAEDAFAKQVGALLTVAVQDLRIQLSFAAGSAPAEILAVYTSNARPTVLSSGSIRLADLYADEERELLIEIRVPTSAVGAHHVISVRCLYKDPASQEVVYGRDQALLVPRPHAVRSSSAPKIERLRNHFITTRAVAEGRRLMEHGDFTSAHHLLASSRALILQSNGGVDDYVRSLEVEMAELQWRRQQQLEVQQVMMSQQRRVEVVIDENGEPLTPNSAWRAAEKLARVAMLKKSLSRVSDLHGFENARF